MALDNIEIIIEKYFQGETSIDEENQLKNYFTSSNVAQHLEHYTPIFGYFSHVKEQKFKQEIPLLPKSRDKKRNVALLSIAASVVVLFGIGTYGYFNYGTANLNQDLGTYDNPEIAFRETQKALSQLSDHVNVGIESVHYIQEFDNSKNLIFKQ